LGVESTLSTCDNEFEGNLDENAEGYVTHQIMSGAQCAREPCHVLYEPNIGTRASRAEGHEGGGFPGFTKHVHIDFLFRAFRRHAG
jgi:hypothetical protein